MIVTISPAKILDFKTNSNWSVHTQPQFLERANKLNELLASIPLDELPRLMQISPKQAFDVYQMIQSFELTSKMKQAAFAYNGIAYQGLEAKSLTEKDFDFAQQHLFILSGLYGILRPLDQIKPYRLDLGTKIETEAGGNLYDFWSEMVTDFLNEKLAQDDGYWINLASNEYSKVVNRKRLTNAKRIITPLFKEHDGTKYRQVIVHAKKARGMMSRFIVQNQLSDVEELKSFDADGYCFNPQLSTKDEWIFTLEV